MSAFYGEAGLRLLAIACCPRTPLLTATQAESLIVAMASDTSTSAPTSTRERVLAEIGRIDFRFCEGVEGGSRHAMALQLDSVADRLQRMCGSDTESPLPAVALLVLRSQAAKLHPNRTRTGLVTATRDRFEQGAELFGKPRWRRWRCGWDRIDAAAKHRETLRPLTAEALRLLRRAVCPRTRKLPRASLLDLLIALVDATPLDAEIAELARACIHRLPYPNSLPATEHQRAATARHLMADGVQLIEDPAQAEPILAVLKSQAAKISTAHVRLMSLFLHDARMTVQLLGARRHTLYLRGWKRREKALAKQAVETLDRPEIERMLDAVLAGGDQSASLAAYRLVVDFYIKHPEEKSRLMLESRRDSLPFGTKTIARPLHREGGDTKQYVKAYGSLEIPLPVLPPSRTPAEIVAILAAEFPWLIAAFDAVMMDLMVSMKYLGHPVISPKLLHGAPGCGKTRFCTRLIALLEQPGQVVNAGGADSPRLLVGTTRGWSGSRPCLPIELMGQARRGQCAVVIDEIDKAATSAHNGRFTDALLNFLEPTTAQNYFDENLLTACDLRDVVWLATANTLEHVSAPLLSRLTVIACPQPQPEHMLSVAEGVLTEHRERFRLPPGDDLLDAQARTEVEALAPRCASARAVTHLVRTKIAESLHRQFLSSTTFATGGSTRLQ